MKKKSLFNANFEESRHLWGNPKLGRLTAIYQWLEPRYKKKASD
ncbi:hypothetical protein STRMA_0010 [Streptococcus macacae NCTC 11558]|uniref:Uncharacterized protein n=1 Tax=Streptococcus macacae NCTC 11558 TaxID=764298 RepID=G5JXW5_9STRE|nr:hypothetical protein STRMA_0010 [Streptococcus macacae NCTC 11558]